MKCVVTPQEAEVEGPLVSLHGGGRGRPKDTSDRRHCSWSMNLLAAAPALKVKRWRQAGRQAGRQAAGRQAGGRASPSVTQEADEEFTRPAKSCCMYIQQPRESHSLLEGGADGVHAAMCHWEDARPAASSAMATSATARSSANNRQQTPPPPPNSNSIHRECAVCN